MSKKLKPLTPWLDVVEDVDFIPDPDLCPDPNYSDVFFVGSRKFYTCDFGRGFDGGQFYDYDEQEYKWYSDYFYNRSIAAVFNDDDTRVYLVYKSPN